MSNTHDLSMANVYSFIDMSDRGTLYMTIDQRGAPCGLGYIEAKAIEAKIGLVKHRSLIC